MTTPSPNARSTRSLATSLQHWLLGLLLCCGAAIVWALLLSWVGAGLSWWLNRAQSFESRSVSLRANGEPIVAIQRYNRDRRNVSVEHETVDGKPIVLEPEELVTTTKGWQMSSFPTSYLDLRRALHEYKMWIDAPEPFPWSISLLQFVDGDLYSGNGRQWYFRWPRRAGGSGFFEGFDLKTKRRVGFIGTSGFSETAPPIADEFPAWDVNKSKTAAFITAYNGGQFPPSPIGMTLSEPGQSLEHGLWFVTPQRDRLFVINLTRRSVVLTRTLTGKLLGTSIQQNVTESSREVVLALWWEDRLEIVSPTLKTLREIPFPSELQGKISTFTELATGEFEASHWSISPKPGDQHFVRFNDRGEVTLRKTVTVPVATASGIWFAEPFLTPLSLMPISVVYWLAPYRSGFVWDENLKPIRQPDEPLTWSLQLRALRIVIRNLGWTFWTGLLSGLPFAALCVWRQRTLPLSNFDRVAWPLLLCLFGIVGWIAFLTHRRWPVRRVAVAEQVTSQLAAA